MGKHEDQGGTGEASGQDDMQSFDKWSPPPTEENWDNYNTKSGIHFSMPPTVLCSYVHVYNYQ